MSTELVPVSENAGIAFIDEQLQKASRPQSLASKAHYLHDLTVFEQWRQGRPLTRLLVEEFVAYELSRGLKPRSINRALSSIRWWAKRLADLAFEEALPKDPEQRRVFLDYRQEIVTQAGRIALVEGLRGDVGRADVKPRVRKDGSAWGEKTEGRDLSDGEFRGLLLACLADSSPAGTRDACLFALARATGARRAELGSLTLADIEPLQDGASLTLRGKGSKVRKVAIFNGTSHYLRDWLQRRGEQPGLLFLGINKGGRILRTGLSGVSMAAILEKRRIEAGIDECTMHDFRHSFASELLTRVDVSTVQKLMGHSDPKTTTGYDRRPEETRQQAVRGVHVPYLKM